MLKLRLCFSIYAFIVYWFSIISYVILGRDSKAEVSANKYGPEAHPENYILCSVAQWVSIVMVVLDQEIGLRECFESHHSYSIFIL